MNERPDQTDPDDTDAGYRDSLEEEAYAEAEKETDQDKDDDAHQDADED